MSPEKESFYIIYTHIHIFKHSIKQFQIHVACTELMNVLIYRFERDYIQNSIQSGWDRHNGEIAAFHLGR